MSLHDELTASPGKCKVCTFLETLHDLDRAEWDRELALPVTRVHNAAVVSALRRRGVVLEESSVRRHRANHAL